MNQDKYAQMNSLIHWLESCSSEEFRRSFQQANGQTPEEAARESPVSLSIGDVLDNFPE